VYVERLGKSKRLSMDGMAGAEAGAFMNYESQPQSHHQVRIIYGCVRITYLDGRRHRCAAPARAEKGRLKRGVWFSRTERERAEGTVAWCLQRAIFMCLVDGVTPVQVRKA
jgi:hypothetical protein